MSLAQLNAARDLVRANPEQYPTIVRGVLPIGDRPEVEIRRWCAAFVADFFCSDAVPSDTKNELASEVLATLVKWVADSDSGVVKLGIIVLCEIYPRIYMRTWAAGPAMQRDWTLVSELKSAALARWNGDSKESIQIAAIKLAQVVVLTHQQIVQGHAVLDHVLLTAEGAGLLDRLLAIFAAPEPCSFALLSASVNAAVALALAQPQLSSRIVAYIVGFDLSKRQVGTASQQPLVLRWIGKLFRLSLHPLSKQFPHIQKYLAGLSSYCANQSLKRRAEDDGPTRSKRPRLDHVELPTGPQPVKALYNLVDNQMSAFFARDLQFNLAVSMAAASLARVDADDLEDCIDVVQKRLSNVSNADEVTTAAIIRPAGATSTTPSPAAKASEQATPAAAQSNSAQGNGAPSSAAVSNPEAASRPSEMTSPSGPRGPSRAALEVEVPPELHKFDMIVNRLLGEAPLRVVARLSARGLSPESPARQLLQKKLYAQLVSDFRASLEPLVLWLSEEYYAEAAREKYFELVARVVDEIVPKLEVDDFRIFIRLLSELPELNRAIIFKIKSICLDPERSVVGARTLKFLIFFKPPCRHDCLDLVQELVQDGVQGIKGVLEKYRPEVKADEEVKPQGEAGPKAEPKVEPSAEPTTEPTTEPKVEPKDEPKDDPKDDPKDEPTANPEDEPKVELGQKNEVVN